VESVTTGREMARLEKVGRLSLSEIVETINKPEGRKRLAAYLDSRPFPRFSAHPKLPDTFVREDEDGTRTVGRFRRGVFEPSAKKSRAVA
jgi:hypothetical protein